MFKLIINNFKNLKNKIDIYQLNLLIKKLNKSITIKFIPLRKIYS